MVADKMNELVRRADVRDEIDRWLDSVGTILIGKGLSSYGELIGCLEDAPAADAGVQYTAEMIDAAPTVGGRLIDADTLLQQLEEDRPYNWGDSEAEMQAVRDWEYFRNIIEALTKQ